MLAVFDSIRPFTAPPAAIISGVLFVLMCARVGRNLYVILLTAIVGCLFQWNLTEWIFEWIHLPDGSKNETLHVLMLVGGTVAVPLYLHFALLVSSSRRAGWLAVAYGTMCVLLLTMVLAVVDDAYYAAYKHLAWNIFFDVYLLAFAGAAIVVLRRRYRRASPSRRGLYGFPLAAGLVLVPLGALDMAFQLPTGNVGAAGASIILFLAFFRHRGTFDGMARLRESTDLLFGALDRGVVTLDGAGRVVQANDTARELLGPELEGVEALAREGLSVVQRGRRILKIGVLRPAGPPGAPADTHVLVEDVTRQSALMNELAQKESLSSLGQAAATLAHEIRNPLTAVRATVDTLTPDAPPTHEQIARLKEQLARLNGVLERGLTLARPIEASIEATDMARLVERVAGLAPAALPVQLEIDGTIPPVPCDPDLIAHVLLNLLRNAEEAGADEVTMRAAPDEAAQQAVVTVANRGPPIPDEILGELFQPFVTTKRRGGGLGLAWSRKVIRAHGGEIEARNTEHGVEIEVRLPWTS